MKKTIRILALLFALATVFSLCSCATSSPESLAKAYVKATMKFDAKKVDSYRLVTIKDCVNYYAERDGLTFKEAMEDGYDVSSLDEYFKKLKEDYKDDAEDEYGKFKFEIRKVDVGKYSPERLEELKDYCENYYEEFGVDIDKISAAASVEIKVRITGEEQSETTETYITVVKYKGQWKVLDRSVLY